MECKCGGSTVDKIVVRDSKPAGEFKECTACGRIMWLWKSDKLEATDNSFNFPLPTYGKVGSFVV